MKVKFNRSDYDWKLGDVIVGTSAQSAGIIIKNSVGDYCAISINDTAKENNFSAEEKRVLNSESYDSIACLQDELESQGYYAAKATLKINVEPDF